MVGSLSAGLLLADEAGAHLPSEAAVRDVLRLLEAK